MCVGHLRWERSPSGSTSKWVLNASLSRWGWRCSLHNDTSHLRQVLTARAGCPSSVSGEQQSHNTSPCSSWHWGQVKRTLPSPGLRQASRMQAGQKLWPQGRGWACSKMSRHTEQVSSSSRVAMVSGRKDPDVCLCLCHTKLQTSGFIQRREIRNTEIKFHLTNKPT